MLEIINLILKKVWLSNEYINLLGFPPISLNF